MPEVLVPILRLYFVPALAYVVAQALAAAFAVKLIYRDCRFEGESLSLRVGPEIVCGTAHAKRSRCYQREQFVLVHRQGLLIFRIFLEIVAEPVREGAVDYAHRLSEGPSGKGGSATARLVGGDHRKAAVGGGSPEGGLGQT